MTDNKIVKLEVVTTVPGQPDPQIIELLEAHLEAAKAGKIAAIAVAASHHDDHQVTSFNVGNCWAKLLGAVSYLQHRIAVYDPDY